jgi:hypothetical protein
MLLPAADIPEETHQFSRSHDTDKFDLKFLEVLHEKAEVYSDY